jgi:hypothetical protein
VLVSMNSLAATHSRILRLPDGSSFLQFASFDDQGYGLDLL